MRATAASFIMACAVAAASPHAQAPAGPAVDRLDPALDALIPPGAQLELLKGDYFGFLEGPVWVTDGPSGYLLFSDVAANRIYKWTPDGQLSTFLDKSGFTGSDTSVAGVELNNGRLQVILLGSNGLTLDGDGRLVFCTHGDRAVKRLEKNGSITVLADRYEGKRFSGPNDLVYRSDGALYFSDVFGGVRGGVKSPFRELPFHGLYLLKDGKLRLLDQDPFGAAPNGLAFSPDEKHLYVGAGPNIVRYDVLSDGTVANRQVLIDMSREKVPGGADGMKVDQNGNIYTVGPGGIWVISPEGKHLGTIRLPGVANLAFGDRDGKTIYFMVRRDLYRLRVNVAGIRPMTPLAR